MSNLGSLDHDVVEHDMWWCGVADLRQYQLVQFSANVQHSIPPLYRVKGKIYKNTQILMQERGETNTNWIVYLGNFTIKLISIIYH